MLDSLKKIFGKTPKEGKESNEPWVNVVNTNFDESNPNQGFMELDWNDAFVKFLKGHGYQGSTDEEIVDAWFTELCRSIGQQFLESEKFVADANMLPKKPRKRVDNKSK